MKIIDILVKIANGEALPEKIKFENHIYYAYHYENRIIDYYYTDELKNQITLFEDSMRNYGITSYLNDEVEIIEDTNEITAEQIMMATYTLNRLKPTIVEATKNWNKVAEEIKKAREEKKIPEKLDKYADVSGGLAYDWTFGEKKLKDKINEIIDCLDYFKSEGDE